MCPHESYCLHATNRGTGVVEVTHATLEPQYRLTMPPEIVGRPCRVKVTQACVSHPLVHVLTQVPTPDPLLIRSIGVSANLLAVGASSETAQRDPVELTQLFAADMTTTTASTLYDTTDADYFINVGSLSQIASTPTYDVPSLPGQLVFNRTWVYDGAGGSGSSERLPSDTDSIELYISFMLQIDFD